MQSLDLNRLLGCHALLALVSSLSNAPVWNLPLALYGLVVTTYNADDQGESLRQFAGLFAASFFLDAFWLLYNETRTLAWFLIVVNFLLKPITLLSTLGQLRQRGHATFDLPGGFTLPGGNGGVGNNSAFGGFPPARGTNETMWQAPGGAGHYHQRSYSQEERTAPPPPPPAASTAPNSSAPKAAQPAPPTATNASAKGYQGSEGGGYHTLE